MTLFYGNICLFTVQWVHFLHVSMSVQEVNYSLICAQEVLIQLINEYIHARYTLINEGTRSAQYFH